MLIRNKGDIINEIATQRMQLDIDAYPHQVDFYLYLDDACEGTVDQFVNAGGNSWINDDHITVISYRPLYDDIPEEEREEYFEGYEDEYINIVTTAVEDIEENYFQLFCDYDNNRYFVPETENGGGLYEGLEYATQNGHLVIVCADVRFTQAELKRFDKIKIVDRYYLGAQ